MDYQYIIESRIQYGKYSLLNHLGCFATVLTLAFQILVLSIIVPIMNKQFQMTKLQKVMIAQTYFIGSFVGGITGGYLADKYGRKNMLVVSNICCITFGYLSSYSSSANLYITIRILVGIFIGIQIVVTFVYLDEIAFKGWKQRNMVLYSIFYQVGNVFMVFIVDLSLKDVAEGDWRLFVRVSNFVMVVTIVLSFLMSQSITYQLEKKRFQEAFDNINYAIKCNNSNAPLLSELEKQQIINTYESKKQDIKQDDGFMVIYESGYMINVVFVSIQWFFGSFTYYSVIWMLPVQVKKDFNDNPDMQKLLLSSAYILEMMSSLIVLLLLSTKCIPFKRIYITILVSMAVMAPAGYLFNQKTFSLLILKALSTVTFDSIMIFGSQLFPVLIKGRSTGVASSCGKTGGAIMPFLMYCVIDFDADQYLACISMISISLMSIVVFMIELIKYPDDNTKYTKFDNENA